MYTNVSNHNPRAGRYRLVAIGLMSMAAPLSAFAQAASAPPATTDQTQTTTAQPAVTTTPPSTQPAAPSDQVVVLNEFTVNGSFAGSLEMAAELKQNSDAITEIIAPEDIGKLPDVSIADALARLTGLTSQRVNGRDQDITIRGLGPDFNVGTLDGVEQATTDNNRAVEYDQYPSELIGGVTVYKTGEADLVGGIGGTVDLHTTSPLSVDHRVVALNAFYNWTGFGQLTPGVKKAGESYTVSYIDQFANGTEGIYVGYAHTENPYEGQQFQAWGYPTTPGGAYILGGMKLYAQSELLKRDSVVAVIESKPDSSIHSKIDLFLSYYNDNQLLRGMEVPMVYYGPAILQPGYTATGGFVTNYTETHINPVIRNMDTQWTAHLASAIWNLDVGENSSWPVHLQAGWSGAKKREEVLETYAGLAFANSETNGGDMFVVTQQPGPNPPQVVSSTNYANASLFTLTDPDGYGTGVFPVSGMEGYLKYFISYDIADSAKVFTKHELDASFLKDVEVGLSVSQRYKQFGQDPSGYLVNANGLPNAPLPPLIGTTDLSFIGNLHPVAYDPNAALESGRYTIVPNPNPGSWEGDNYQVWETVTRPYFKFDLKGNIGGLPFEGNIGAVVDFAKQNSTGLGGNGNLVYPVSGSATYADFLPSLNLIFKPTSMDLIRLFIGREEQRPEMYQMRAGRDFSYNAQDALSSTISPWGATSGNPSIHPWVSNSADLDFEHYFAKGGGYVSVALFEKKLLTYIYQQNTVESFAGYPYTSAQPPVLTQGVASQYVNGTGGNISGVEATVQIGSEVFTGGAVKGFGVVLNGLIVDSSIQPFGPGNGSEPLNNMSKKSANVQLYYESHGFAVRVSEHYQSQTREYIVQFGPPNFAGAGSANDGYSEETPFHSIDAQLSYAFRSGPLNGFSIYVEGRNLNNAALVTYNNGDPRQLANWQKYGASYRSGVSYKF
jgi:iron complex outermembrane receptor protein